MADTPVVVLLALMASASRRALRVVPSVAIAVPLIDSAPGVRPPVCRLAPSAVPVMPKVPPPTAPSEKLMVVLAPRPMAAVVDLNPPEASVCAWEIWLMLTRYEPALAVPLAVAVKMEESPGATDMVWKLLIDVRLDNEDWNAPSALDRLP